MIVTKVMSPEEFARAIALAYPENALEVALDIVLRVSKRQALDTMISLCNQQPQNCQRLPREETVRSIVALVCAHFAIEPEELSNKRRSKLLAMPRAICWALMRDRLRLTFAEIAQRYGRDHTTVLFACRKVDRNSPDWIEISRRLDAARFVDVAEAAE